MGRPVPGVTVALRPDQRAQPGSGRVHVTGKAVTERLRRAAHEDAAFEAGGFLTGDLGRLDDRRTARLHGRVSAFVNVAGRKVQPDEVETIAADPSRWLPTPASSACRTARPRRAAGGMRRAP